MNNEEIINALNRDLIIEYETAIGYAVLASAIKDREDRETLSGLLGLAKDSLNHSKTVIDLIIAFGGKPAEGAASRDPFGRNEDIDALLHQSLKIERTMMDDYAALANKSPPSSKIKETLAKLSETEMRHAIIVEKIIERRREKA